MSSLGPLESNCFAWDSVSPCWYFEVAPNLSSFGQIAPLSSTAAGRLEVPLSPTTAGRSNLWPHFLWIRWFLHHSSHLFLYRSIFVGACCPFGSQYPVGSILLHSKHELGWGWINHESPQASGSWRRLYHSNHYSRSKNGYHLCTDGLWWGQFLSLGSPMAYWSLTYRHEYEAQEWPSFH